MKRDEARGKLVEHVAGDLGEAEAREVEALLAGDPGLAREADELGEVLAALREPRATDPPPGYHDHLAGRLVARMREEGVAFGERPRRAFLGRLAAFVRSLEAAQIAAAAVVLLFLTIGARVVVHRLGQVPAEVALARGGEGAVAPDSWNPPDEEIASLSDREARAVAGGLTGDLEASLAGELAHDPDGIIALSPGESSVSGELTELNAAQRGALYADLGREMAL